MCGRYGLIAEPIEVAKRFGLPMPITLLTGYNLSPGRKVSAVGQDLRGRRMGELEWGVPLEGSSNMINLRIEGLDSRPFWLQRLERARLLLPASFFYEWKKIEGKSRPEVIKPLKEPLMAFAGLFHRFEKDGKPHVGLVILTAPASKELLDIHDRMPVVMGEGDQEKWLDPATKTLGLLNLLRTASREQFTHYPVSTKVNSPSADGEDLIQPL